MATKIWSPNDVTQKLHNSLCMYEGLPVWVEHLGDGTLNITAIIRDKKLVKYSFGTSTRIKVEDPKFDYASPKLGYYYDGVTCQYLMRSPRRQYLQGLSSATVVSSRHSSGNVISNSAMRGDAFGRCVLGLHDDYVTCVKQVIEDGEMEEKPFHRYFSISMANGLGSLNMKGRTVGIWNQESEKFRLISTPNMAVVYKTLVKYKFASIIEN